MILISAASEVRRAAAARDRGYPLHLENVALATEKMPKSQVLVSKNKKLRNKTRLVVLRETSLCQEEMVNAVARTSALTSWCL